MRDPNPRPSPASPPGGKPPRKRSTGREGQADSNASKAPPPPPATDALPAAGTAPALGTSVSGQGSASATAAATADARSGVATISSINPLAPASAATQSLLSPADSPELNLRYLRPAPNQKETWNRQAGPCGQPARRQGPHRHGLPARRVSRGAPHHYPGAAASRLDAPLPDPGRRPDRARLRRPDDPRGLPGQRHRSPDALLRAQAARASAPAGCASSKSRARSIRRSRAPAPRSRAWWSRPRPRRSAASAAPTSS